MAQQTLLNGVPFLEQRTKINANFTELYGISSGNVTLTGIQTLTNKTLTSPIASANSTSPALTVSQSGTGFCLLVEDSASDSTPFGINGDGLVLVGATSSIPARFYGSSYSNIKVQITGTGANDSCMLSSAFGTAYPTHIFAKSTAASKGVHGAVVNDDYLGGLVFDGSDGSAFFTAADIRAAADGAVSSGIVPGRLVFYTTDSTGSAYERLRIDSSGRIGIGTGSLSTQKMRVYNAITNPTTSQTNLTADGSMTITADSAFSHGSLFSSYVNHGTYNATASMGNGGVCNLKSYVYATGTGGVVTALAGFYADVRNVGSGTVAGLAGLSVKFVNSGGGTVSNVYGIYIPDHSISTNTYAVYSGIASGTNKYGIYCIGTADNYLNGKTTVNAEFKPKSITETIFAITDGASVDLNPLNGGIQTWTLGASRSPTATTFADGQSMTLSIDDGTAYTITWPSVTWVGGSAPTLATTGKTWIELFKVNGVLYGALVGTTA